MDDSMDVPKTINSEYRPDLDEDEDWFRFLNLDDTELPSLLGEISFPGVASGLEVLDSVGGNLNLKALNSIALLNEAPLSPFFDASRVDNVLSKRERAPSSHRASLTSSNSSQPFKKKAKKKRFTIAQTDVLQTWLDCHVSYPYPQKKEKEDLSAASGLTVCQIQAWFARTRQRKLRPRRDDNLQSFDFGDGSQARHVTRSHPGSQNTRSPQRSSLQVLPASPQPYHADEHPESEISDLQFQDFENRHGHTEPSGLSCGASKVHWWLDTLPDDAVDYDAEPAFEDDLYPDATRPNSLGSTLSCSSNQSHLVEISPYDSFKLDRVAMRPPRARESISVSSSSLGTNFVSSRRSSCGTDYLSVSSAKTFDTSSTSYSFSRRRGRRMSAKPRSSSPRELQKRQKSEEKKYYCTFCAMGFHDKYTWRRHEESMHAPQKSWICKAVQPREDQPPVCPLCYVEGGPAHCLHDMQPCWSKLEKDRTFYRKDNLVQHLEGVHNAPAGISSALLYELAEDISVVPYDLTCHFCEHQNTAWLDRATHIAGHFESGMTMASWKRPEARNGVSATLDQNNPYVPQLSRLRETDSPQELTCFQQKPQLQSPPPICRSRQPRLPRIVTEDYSAVGKSQVGKESSRSIISLDKSRNKGQINSTMDSEKEYMRTSPQEEVCGLPQSHTTKMERKLKFKSVFPQDSLKGRIQKLFKGNKQQTS